MEGDPLVGDALDKVRDGFDLIRAASVIMDQGGGIRKLMSLHGLLIALELFRSAVGIGIINIQDLAALMDGIK